MEKLKKQNEEEIKKKEEEMLAMKDESKQKELAKNIDILRMKMASNLKFKAMEK